jgi:GTP cyclohydrolase II
MPVKVLHQSDSKRQLELSADAALLDLLAGPTPPSKARFAKRDAALEPLLIAAATASGPHVTRNHYHHNFFPAVLLPSEGKKDTAKRPVDDSSSKSERRHFAYVSRQAPRRQRLQNILNDEYKENSCSRETVSLDPPQKRRPSQSNTLDAESIVMVKSPRAPLEVKCMARTRIPTPHGPVFLHLYHNNRDGKEHLAIVVDPAQLSASPDPIQVPPIRSRSLDDVWSASETDMDRIIRGAYVARLSPMSAKAAPPPLPPNDVAFNDSVPPPLVRIHSECFTGETVGSMRCDCGEQLDEAIRRISEPIRVGEATIPGRGAVIYLRQEGRGIGLLSKIRAYNLQDLGHDTVTANLMLGYGPDERGYEVAAAILNDLGVGTGGKGGVKLLTNNPDKVEAVRKEGIEVVERIAMVPRSWQQRQKDMTGEEKAIGATMVAVHGEDLDKYLRTKVLRMGHMLPL